MNKFKRLEFGGILFLLVVISLNSHAQSFTNIAGVNGIEAINLTSDGGGVGISSYDYNQDGWDDLSFVQEDGVQKIYLNNQGAYELAPISFFSTGENKQLLWVDYDNDGDLDIFLTRKNGINLLLNNDGNLQFTDVTLSSGLSMEIAANLGASFADYDLDGDLDLYICKYLGVGDTTNSAHLNNLYRNNGNGTFSDATFVSGLVNEVSPSFQGLWLDYNHDLYPDLYVINDRVPWANIFYRNNGDGTFTNIASLNQTEMNGSDAMSISLGDYDNDGDQDFFVSDAGSPNTPKGSLFSQTPSLNYTDEASNLGIGIETTMWGSTWLDYNNDGFLDLYVANEGFPGPKNLFYVNDSTESFVIDTSIFIGDYGVTSFGVASADFNRDGFPDIAAVNFGVLENFLWLNTGGTNNYIRISLEGTVSNSFAIGSYISVFANNQVYTKYTVCGENYLGQNSQHHLFGVGLANVIDSVHVEYPSGIVDRYYSLAVNNSYIFQEGESLVSNIITITGDSLFCEGDSIVLSAPDLLSYDWNTGDTSQHILVDSAGQYKVNGVDSNGLAVESDLYIVQEIVPPSISSLVDDVSCYNDTNGKAHLIVHNQGQSYQIEWFNGVIGDSLDAQGVGTYSYVYTDVYGCQLIDSIEIENPFPIDVQMEITAETDTALGSINMVINGGTPPYLILFEDDTIGVQLENLSNGIYYLEIWDHNLCFMSDSILIPLLLDTTINTAVSTIHSDGFKTWFDYENKKLLLSNIVSSWEELDVILYTVLGEKMSRLELGLQGDEDQLKVDFSFLDSSGLYFIVLSNEEFFETIPVMFHE